MEVHEMKAISEVKDRGGFTLIELLVVVSIIALLVSILLPALGRARDSAKSAVCISNLRQQGLSMLAYHADYNDTYAPTFTWFYKNGRVSVYERLKPYGPETPGQDVTKPTGIWVCPSDKPAQQYPKTYPPPAGPDVSYAYQFTYWDVEDNMFKYVSYAYHITAQDGGDMGVTSNETPLGSIPYGLCGFINGKGRKADTVRWPSNVVMFVEGSYGRCLTYFTDYGGDDRFASYVDPFHSRSDADRGKGAVNLLACDGHAESVRDLVENTEERLVPELGLELIWSLPESWYRVDGGGPRWK